MIHLAIMVRRTDLTPLKFLPARFRMGYAGTTSCISAEWIVKHRRANHSPVIGNESHWLACEQLYNSCAFLRLTSADSRLAVCSVVSMYFAAHGGTFHPTCGCFHCWLTTPKGHRSALIEALGLLVYHPTVTGPSGNTSPLLSPILLRPE